MASVFKPYQLKPIPEGARRVKVKGKPHVRYPDQRDREHVREIRTTPSGVEKMVVEQSRWWLR